MLPRPIILAAGEIDQRQVILWGVVLMVVVIAGFGLIMLVRRKLNEPADTPDDGGFSLSDLRSMRDRGEITPEEYERTRANIIAKVKTMMKKEENEAGDADSAA